MVEKMLLAHEQTKVFVVLLTNLSKNFDCISHDLFKVKLNAYGFDRNLLKVIHDYLSASSQKTEASSSFSDIFRYEK